MWNESSKMMVMAADNDNVRMLKNNYKGLRTDALILMTKELRVSIMVGGRLH